MIKRFRVRNYRSIRDLELTLGSVNVLVGRNMAGKSNIVDAFAFLQQFFSPTGGIDGLNYALAERAGISEVVWKGGSDRLVAFEIEIAEDKEDQSFVYGLEIVMGEGEYASIQNESLVLRTASAETPLVGRDANGYWMIDEAGRKSYVGSSGSRSLMQHWRPSWQGYPFLQSVSSWRFHQFIPAKMKQRNKTGQGQVLSRDGSNLSAWLMWLQTRSPAAFNKIDEVARDVFPGIRSLLTWPTQDEGVHLASQEEFLRRPTNVWQMSDGEIVFLALLSLIYTPRDLGASLLCLEEPENYLHPDLISTLMDLTRQVREEMERAGQAPPQLIITTHSPYFVDASRIEEIIWVEKRNGATSVVRPDAMPHLQKLVADKEMGLGDIVYSGLLQDAK